MKTPERDTDGVLIIQPGVRYTDPGEALKRWWAGRLVLTCTEGMYSNYASRPCDRKPTCDPDHNGNPTKCKQHSAEGKAKRKAAAKARSDKMVAGWKRDAAIHEAQKAVEPALRRIAEGHNDPRSLAQEVLAALDAARGMPK